MEFKLNFNMDNAAFDGTPKSQTNAILEDVGFQVMEGKIEGIIRDDNGNRIGKWEIETD